MGTPEVSSTHQQYLSICCLYALARNDATELSAGTSIPGAQ